MSFLIQITLDTSFRGLFKLLIVHFHTAYLRISRKFFVQQLYIVIDHLFKIVHRHILLGCKFKVRIYQCHKLSVVVYYD